MPRGRRNLFTWSRNYTRIQCTLRAAAKSPASCFDHSAPDDFRTRRSSIKGQRYGYTVDAPGTPGGQHCRRHRIQLKDQAAPAVLERSPGCINLISPQCLTATTLPICTGAPKSSQHATKKGSDVEVSYRPGGRPIRCKTTCGVEALVATLPAPTSNSNG